MNYPKYYFGYLWAVLLVVGTTHSADAVSSFLYDPLGRIIRYCMHSKNETAKLASIFALYGILAACLCGPVLGAQKLKEAYAQRREKQLKAGTIQYPELRIHCKEASLLKHYTDWYPQEGVIINVECNTLTASEASILFHELLEWKRKYQLPVIAYIKGRCTVLHYHIALAADQIVCGPLAYLEIEPMSDNPTYQEVVHVQFTKDASQLNKNRAQQYIRLLSTGYKNPEQSEDCLCSSQEHHMRRVQAPKIITAKELVEKGLSDKVGTREDAGELIRTILRDTRPIKWYND